MELKEVLYTVSARGKSLQLPVMEYLEEQFGSIPLGQIDSVFGFLEPSTMYSGRPFMRSQLSDEDVKSMNEAGIGMRIPFSNHYVSEKEYESHRAMLEKYHRKDNSLICTNDQLAGWVRRDYPLYQVEASVLKEIDSLDKIEKALEIYDYVILPMFLNYKDDFLSSIPWKHKITLFGNAGCALSCPNRKCYEYISRVNKDLAMQKAFGRQLIFLYRLGFPIHWCSHRLKPRNLKGLTDFDLEHLYSLGFRRFKMLREHKSRRTGY